MRQAFSLPALAGFCFILTSGQPTQAFQVHRFDQRYLVEPGFTIKDHTLIQAAGDTFHIYYIKADQSVPESQTAKSLGHATSMNLRQWTIHPSVIPSVPGTWEEQHIWAPHVVQKTSGPGAPPVYYLFYTGVTASGSQAIGVAVSNDLYNWTKSTLNPVYRPDTTWALWSTSSYSNCRDPFVFLDNGVWHLLTTAMTQSSEGAVSHATSNDLFTWTDQGPLFVHPGPQAWRVFESPQLHSVNGKYHFFFNEENATSTSYLNAPAILGPWNYSQKQIFDQGRAIELTRTGADWLLSRHASVSFLGTPLYTIKFDDVRWSDDQMPLVIFSPGTEGWFRVSGTAFSFQPTFWDNTLARGAGPCNFAGNSWIGTYERFQGPLQNGQPGNVAGNTPVGVLRTWAFVLTGNRIAFRIGGSVDSTNVYFGLCTNPDNVLRISSTGVDGSEWMSDVVWDVSAWTGQSVYLKIVDASITGHINLDEVVEYYQPPITDVGGTPGVRRAVLHAAAPNPFNPATTLSFDLPQAAHARLELFDVRGRRLRTLFDAPLGAGTHRVVWDGKLPGGGTAASGTYLYQLFLDGAVAASRSATLVK